MQIIDCVCETFWDIKYLMFLSHKYEKVGLLVVEFAKTVQSKKEVQLPSIMVGGSVFPHHSLLQKPFDNILLSEKESHFNYCLNRARMVVECAFGQLKVH